MEDFGTNPDIDEKPPISLQDALEKMKPFLMAYEGIQSQSEWEVCQLALLCQLALEKMKPFLLWCCLFVRSSTIVVL